jgi:hypothetical protein
VIGRPRQALGNAATPTLAAVNAATPTLAPGNAAFLSQGG